MNNGSRRGVCGPRTDAFGFFLTSEFCILTSLMDAEAKFRRNLILIALGHVLVIGGGVYWGVHHPVEAAHLAGEGDVDDHGGVQRRSGR